jgi:hypothetical protein
LSSPRAATRRRAPAARPACADAWFAAPPHSEPSSPWIKSYRLGLDVGPYETQSELCFNRLNTELAGQQIKEGDKLALWYVAGNRDESAFENPQRFDVRREPNDHQGFGGGGRHFCLGAGLARLELKLWIEETLRRFPNLALGDEPTRVSSTFLNQYRTIPVSLLGPGGI